MLEFQFADFDDQYSSLLTKKKNVFDRKRSGWFSVEEAANALQLLYNELSTPENLNNPGTRVTLVSRHIDEEAKQKSDSRYEVELFGGDGRSNNLADVLDDAINSKPEGADDFDRRLQGIVHGVLHVQTATVDATDFPEGADVAAPDFFTESSNDVEPEIVPEPQYVEEEKPELQDDVQMENDSYVEDDFNWGEESKTNYADDAVVDDKAEVEQATVQPNISNIIPFDEFTKIDLQSPDILKREDLLAAVGLKADANDELSQLKIAHVLSLYDANNLDALMKELQVKAQKNHLDAIDQLKNVYETVNESGLVDAVTERVNERIDVAAQDETQNSNDDIEGYEKESVSRQNAVDEQTQQKIEAFAAQAHAEASKEKERIAGDTVARRTQRMEQYQTALAGIRDRLAAEQREAEVNERNAALIAKRTEILASYIEEDAAIASEVNKKQVTLQNEARAAFAQIEEDYKAEVEKREQLAAQRQDTEVHQQLAAQTKRANDLQEETNRLQAENTEKFTKVAQANAQNMAMMYPVPNQGQNNGLGSGQLFELEKALTTLTDANQRLTEKLEAQNHSKQKRTAVIASVVAAATIGLAGVGGTLAYSHLQAQQAENTARITAQLNKKTDSSSAKQSLTDLIASGDYAKAASDYPNVTAIEKITDVIFASGDATQLETFVAGHPSVYGKLDEAILAKDNTAIKNQYAALSSQDQQRMNTAQQNAVKAAQAVKGSDTNAQEAKEK